ncbi:MAG: DUF58 domain-containing protein [Ardenticatenaceae bacterium]|nr:DUF58 domain-containing protein [Ardenticatenaceae bacterium]
MMNDMSLVEGLAQDNIKKARKRLAESVRRGETPRVEDLAAARGLKVAERENSILSDAWLPLGATLIIGGFLLNRNVSCMTLGLFLIGVVVLGRWWKDQALKGVYYTREFDRTHVFPGESVSLMVSGHNEKRLPLTWLQFQDRIDGPVIISSEFHPPIETIENSSFFTTFAMRGFEQQNREYNLRFFKRGFYYLGPVTYRSGDIFTLFTIEQEYDPADVLVVYPHIWSLEELGLPPKEPFGDLRIHRSLFTDPIRTLGIRDYHPTDRFRDVHWKATARRGQLQTKIFDPSTGMTAVVFLNIATEEKYWMGHEPELLERLVAVAASIANFGAEQGWGVGLYANGSVPRSDQPIRVKPGRSPQQLVNVLEALAAISGFATGPINRLLHRYSPRLPWSATLVVVTAVLTPELLVTLQNLKESGRRIALISLAEDPPPQILDNMIVYHIPASVSAFQSEQVAHSGTTAALQSVSMAQLEKTKDEKVETREWRREIGNWRRETRD